MNHHGYGAALKVLAAWAVLSTTALLSGLLVQPWGSVKRAERGDFPRYSKAFRFAGCGAFELTNGDRQGDASGDRAFTRKC
jgi:hypothetical protein